MDKDQTFWVSLNSIFCITIVLVAFLTADYWDRHNQKIVDMIKSGVTPAGAMCAMQDDYGDHPTCIILATKTESK
jgi:hypothetical protein